VEQNDITKMLQAFNDLWSKKIEVDVLDRIKPPVVHDPYQSDTCSELCMAFAKAQGEFPTIGHNRDNAFFKSSYADLHAIASVVRPILSKHGLSYTQFTVVKDAGEVILHTRLMHTSGQWIETRSRIIPEKGDVQSYGRAVSYHKRYALMGLLGLTASNDSSDDDAEGLMEKHRTLAPSSPHHYDPKKQSPTTITKEQVEELEMELDGYPDLAKAFLHAMKIEELCDLPQSMYHDARRKILERKKTLNTPTK